MCRGQPTWGGPLVSEFGKGISTVNFISELKCGEAVDNVLTKLTFLKRRRIF